MALFVWKVPKGASPPSIFQAASHQIRKTLVRQRVFHSRFPFAETARIHPSARRSSSLSPPGVYSKKATLNVYAAIRSHTFTHRDRVDADDDDDDDVEDDCRLTVHTTLYLGAEEAARARITSGERTKDHLSRALSLPMG